MSETVPEGWRFNSIAECCEILDSQRIPLNSEERSKRLGEYPYYGANGIQGYIDDFIFDGDAILVAEDGGNFDQYAERPIAQWVTGKYWVNNHAHILRAKENDLDKWIFYSLVHKNILKFINGGTRAKLNQSDLREIQISLPPLPEQKKIASILTSVDEVIETTQKQIDKLQDLKKATMNELLTKGIGHTEFKDSELGRIPKSWETVGVSDVCEEIFLGLTSKVDYVDSGGVYLVRATDISKGVLDFSKTKQISREQHQKLTKYRRAKKGDVLVSKSGSLGVCALVDTDTEFSIYESIIVMQSDEEVLLSNFLLWFFRSSLTQHQLLGDSVGSTVGHLNLGDFRKLRMTLPSLDEQMEIANKISEIDAYLNLKNIKLSQTQSLKKSLMQDLLTGKVRVKVN